MNRISGLFKTKLNKMIRDLPDQLNKVHKKVGIKVDDESVPCDAYWTFKIPIWEMSW